MGGAQALFRLPIWSRGMGTLPLRVSYTHQDGLIAMGRTRNRFKFVVSWTLQILLAMLFAVQGAVKLMGSPNWIARFNRWGYPHNFYLLVGVAELAGAALLLIPKLSKFGAVLLFLVMIGAAATHLLHHEPQVTTTLLLLALLGTVFYLRLSGRKLRPNVPGNPAFPD